jgi:hypothetical protein
MLYFVFYKRNLQVRDIVLVQDNSEFRGNWKLGQVAEVKPGKDNIIRDVTIRCKNVGPGTKYTGYVDSSVSAQTCCIASG